MYLLTHGAQLVKRGLKHVSKKISDFTDSDVAIIAAAAQRHGLPVDFVSIGEGNELLDELK